MASKEQLGSWLSHQAKAAIGPGAAGVGERSVREALKDEYVWYGLRALYGGHAKYDRMRIGAQGRR